MKRNIKKTKRMLLIEEQQGEKIENILRTMFVDRNMLLRDIGKELNLNRQYVADWLDRCGIYSRHL